jgi:drug/metabolite transporter (DMT)-like permease
MPVAAVALAFAAAFCFGLGLILSQIGLRSIAPVAGAAISIPTSTLLFLIVAMFSLDPSALSWTAVAIFAAVGVLYPATGTLLTFAANRRLGPVITGTLGNLAPIFAVTLAFLFLGEPLRPGQLAGLAVIVAGVMVLTVSRTGRSAHWRSWFLLLPLMASGIRGLVQPTIKYGLTLWPSPIAATLIGYLVSTAIVLAAARKRTGRWLANGPKPAKLAFAGVGVANGLAVLLLYLALARGPVTLVSPLVATYPLATIAIGALVYRRIDGGARLVFGVAMTVAGVALLIAG